MSTEAERTIEAYQNGVFNVDGWVVMYPSCTDAGRPLFVTRMDNQKWSSGSLQCCTVFETYDEAASFARTIPYIMKQPPHLRRILKLKIQHSAELIEDLPIGLLDALAEL